MIAKLDGKQLKQLYKTHILRDFPPDEVRPLFMTRRLHRRGNYTFLALCEDGEMIAYAGFLHKKGVPAVLMDYFAVAEHLRGGGVGSRFLRELVEWWDVDGIIVECELPGAAPTDEERAVRERRIRFYQRNGARLLPLGWRVFSVDYRLLWVRVNKAGGDAGAYIRELYALSMPRFMWKKHTRLYPLEGETTK